MWQSGSRESTVGSMPPDDPQLRDLSTRWSLLVRALAGEREAQAELLPRYCAAVFRHLLTQIRDESAVEELCQEFAYRFVRGDFRHARPERGRFRDYVAVSLHHLVGEYRRRIAKVEKQATFDSRTLAAEEADPAAAFRDQWKRELLNRTWSALRQECDGEPPTLYDVLRRKADAPEMPSARLAEELSHAVGRTISTVNARQMLHRSRVRFAELLREEVAISIATQDRLEVDAELAELGLLVYFAPA